MSYVYRCAQYPKNPCIEHALLPLSFFLPNVMTLMTTLRGFPQIFAGDELGVRSRDRSQGHGGLRVEFPER